MHRLHSPRVRGYEGEMGKIGLRPGTWTNTAAFLLSGAGAVTGATAEQEAYQVLGWIGMALGLLILLWGITWDGALGGEHSGENPKSRKKMRVRPRPAIPQSWEMRLKVSLAVVETHIST